MKELISLPDITAAHKLLIELDSYIEDPGTGEPHDSYFERLENVFFMVLSKSGEKEAMEALRVLREFTDLAAKNLESEARVHLSNNNEEVRDQNRRLREQVKEREKRLNS